jgi:hypothetical protein
VIERMEPTDLAKLEMPEKGTIRDRIGHLLITRLSVPSRRKSHFHGGTVSMLGAVCRRTGSSTASGI